MAGVGGGLDDLDMWLAPFLAVMGRKTRRAWAPFYLRGLLGPGARKSLQPMAAGPGLSGYDQLQHFVASTAWDDSPLWAVLAQEADRLVGGPDAFLVIDDTALPRRRRPYHPIKDRDDVLLSPAAQPASGHACVQHCWQHGYSHELNRTGTALHLGKQETPSITDAALDAG